MTIFKSRSAWTTTAPKSNGSWAKVRGIAVHYPASGGAIGVASEATVARLLRGWRSYHVNSRGWADIGYNFAVDQSGRVWTLRGLSNVGSHCASASWKSANEFYVGVLFVVGNNEKPTKEALKAFHDLRAVVLERFPGANEVTGHGQVYGAQTACPGTPLRNLINAGALTAVGSTHKEESMAELTESNKEWFRNLVTYHPKIQDQGREWAVSTIWRRVMILLREDRAWRAKTEGVLQGLVEAFSALSDNKDYSPQELSTAVQEAALAGVREGTKEMKEEIASEVIESLRLFHADNPYADSEEIASATLSLLAEALSQE